MCTSFRVSSVVRTNVLRAPHIMSVAIDIQTVAKQKNGKPPKLAANHKGINIDDTILVFSKWLLTLDGTEQWGW